MKFLSEEFNPNIFKQSEAPGSDPLPISKVLSPNETISRRGSEITKFFDETENGFTYKKFNGLIAPFGKLFGALQDAQKKIRKFAKLTKTEKPNGDVEIEYDEYVETFFMYLYYQLFVKLFSQQDLIIAKNKESIKNAKDLMASVPESLDSDMEDNLVKLYRSFYSIFASSMVDPNRIKTDKASQEQYFENFANQNVGMFTEYPLSGFMKDTGSMKIKDFVDSMFDAVNSISPDNTSNRQVMTIRMLSEFISGSNADFDIVRFQQLTKEYPSFTAADGPIKFPSKLEPIVSDVITELSSIDDIDEIGMGWAKGTKWEPYIKILCGIVCLEEVSNKIKATAKTMRKQKSQYQRVLDVGEADKGVYFINNQAFVAATERVAKFKNIIDDLDKVIGDIRSKTQYFQTKKDRALIEAMFVKYDANEAAMYIERLGKEKESLITIMELTDLLGQFGGGDFSNAVAEINFILFSGGNETAKTLSDKNEDSVAFAKANVGDFILDEITKSKLSAFSPTSTWQTVKDIASSGKEFFTKAIEGENLLKAFNETFLDQFNFATMKKTSSWYSIEIDDELVYKIKDLEDFKTYVKNMCISMGSIMYHSKVAFGGPSNQKDARYQEYFNVLSWFVKALNDTDKGRALGGEQYPFAYLVTPFLLEVIKYSLRTFVNEIEDVLFEDGAISKELRDQVKESHKMDSMEDDEWMPIVEKLTEAIEEYLKKK